MKLRSRGLGRRELVMDFREYEIKRDGNEVVIEGTIHEPVTWDFSIRIAPGDIPGMLRVGVNRHTLGLGARWIFHRKAHPSETLGDGKVDKAEKTGRRERAEKLETAEKFGSAGDGKPAVGSRAAGGFGGGLRAG
jgi:hypothetical protein